MALIDQAKANLLVVYNRLWDDWYAGIAGATKAPLIVEQGDHAPGYLKGTIYLFLDGFDLDGAAEAGQHDPVQNVAGMPSWQRDLIHEMMHEFQDKVARLSAPSEEGKALLAKYPKRFGGPGHDAWFFAAIASKATYFGVTPDVLVQQL